MTRFVASNGFAKRAAWRAGLLAIFVLSPTLLAAPAAPPDTIEQRVKACIACHGAQGRATSGGYYPRIAGKPEGYLYNQLVNFRDGRRHYPPMVYMVGHLPDAYLKEIAHYFAEQHPPFPPAQSSKSPLSSLERGKTLVTAGDPGKSIPACIACHDKSLMGVAPSVPGLLGLPSAYVYAQLSNWKEGQRRAAPPDCMAHIVAQMGNDDIVAIANWLSAQSVPADAAPVSTPAAPPPLRCGSIPE